MKALFKLALLLGALAVAGLVLIVGYVWVIQSREGGGGSSLDRGNRREVLLLLVRRETRGLIVTNDTDSTWVFCTAAITGNYTLTIPEIKPRATINFTYRKFKVGSTTLEEDQGYARAVRGVAIACNGPDGRQEAKIE